MHAPVRPEVGGVGKERRRPQHDAVLRAGNRRLKKALAL
jgi:hypothetical protein